ncbi:hypothetical protein KQ944_10640 [Bacillus subtilis]|nr:hypothetical protein [Bacillus subtilis]
MAVVQTVFPIKKLKHNLTGHTILPSAAMAAMVVPAGTPVLPACPERAAMVIKEEQEALVVMAGQEAPAEAVA